MLGFQLGLSEDFNAEGAKFYAKSPAKFNPGLPKSSRKDAKPQRVSRRLTQIFQPAARVTR